MKPELRMAIACIVGMLLCLAWGAARAETNDKDLHFVAGAGIYVASYIVIDAAWDPLQASDDENDYIFLPALSICAASGVAKEALDSTGFRNGVADPWDAAATMGGCLMGAFFTGVSVELTKQTLSLSVRF